MNVSDKIVFQTHPQDLFERGRMMRAGAGILAFAGAFSALLIAVAVFAGAELPLLARATAGIGLDPGGARLLTIVICIAALSGAGMMFSRPLGGGLLLFACVEAIVLTFGLTWLVIAPVLLLMVASLLGVLAAREGVAVRNTVVFGLSLPQSVAFLALVFAITVCPYMLYPVFLMKVLCFALFACAFNLLIGYVGLMSFGHAAYFGMGSYVTAWTAKNWGLSAEVAILLGGLTGAGLGTVFGWLAIRRQGIYFAMITLALAQMNYFFCLQAPFTGGEDGIQQVPRAALFGLISLRPDMNMYWVTAAVFVTFFLVIHRTVHSPFGQVLKAIRENEPRATSLGYRTDDYKLLAFVLSCFIAGIAGGTKSLVFGIATLTDVHYSMSGDVVLMTLLGGLGTIFGPVAGAAVIVGLENYLAQFGSWVTVTQGAIFVICVLAFRRGIVGEIAALFKTSL